MFDSIFCSEKQILEEDLEEESSTEEEEDLMMEETDLTPVEDSDLPQIMAAVIIYPFQLSCATCSSACN